MVKIATKKQIKRLYFLLYKKGLSPSDVKEAVDDICRELGVWAISEITAEEIQKAYKLVDKIK